MFKKNLWISACILTIAIFVFAGCDKQAKSDTQDLKTAPKASIADNTKTGCISKAADTKCTKSKEKKGWYAKKEKCAAVKKECKAAKKGCPTMAKNKCSAEMAKKCAADPNMMKNCPMKDKKGCPTMAEKKCSAEMAKKCAADPNMMKNCPMKGKKGCPMMKNKKGCCAKKGANDPNAPAKP
ncbi:MAG: hypothetical protein WC496_06130 [Phycisphaerae bacterium]